jgi:hypothetical protein
VTRYTCNLAIVERAVKPAISWCHEVSHTARQTTWLYSHSTSKRYHMILVGHKWMQGKPAPNTYTGAQAKTVVTQPTHAARTLFVVMVQMV